jgi:dipeptidyl aminopeptidase/acylaminoacyl peptidase
MPQSTSCGVLSPDGTAVLLYGGGELRLREWKTGTDRHVVKIQQPNEQTRIDAAVLAPDGKTIAYGWNTNDAYELRLVNTDGSGARVLVHRDKGVLQPRAWSPDGKHLLVWNAYNNEPTTHIGIVDVQTGSVRILRSAKGVSVSRYAFSPDARYIIYSAVEGQRRQARVMSLTDEFDAPLLGAIESYGWFALWNRPDRVTFWKQNTGTLDVVSVAMKDGKPDGELAVLVRAFDKEAYAICGVTPDKTLVYVAGTRNTGFELRTLPTSSRE